MVVAWQAVQWQLAPCTAWRAILLLFGKWRMYEGLCGNMQALLKCAVGVEEAVFPPEALERGLVSILNSLANFSVDAPQAPKLVRLASACLHGQLCLGAWLLHNGLHVGVRHRTRGLSLHHTSTHAVPSAWTRCVASIGAWLPGRRAR